MVRVLVVGATGMLGSMVHAYLRRNPKLTVHGTAKKCQGDLLAFDAHKPAGPQLDALPKADCCINCIGIIKPHCKDDDPKGVREAIAINALFPHDLAQACAERKIKAIQIATDCVFSGAKGPYDEAAPHDPFDAYGKSKSLGEAFGMLHLRCSIVGPERKGKLSLLEWFLGQRDGAQLKGFMHHLWNGVTTLRFAKLCEQIVVQDAHGRLLAASHVHHVVPKDVVNKRELLELFKDVFEKDVTISPVGDIGPAVDRRLATRYGLLEQLLPQVMIAQDLRELRAFIDGGSWP